MSDSPADPLPLRSIHTTNFPFLLKQLGISLIVSTYQAGKLIVIRADSEQINTHFRVFNKPMGMAVTREKMAIGCAFQIWELRNVPAVTKQLEPCDRHDACFLPRQTHITGDIDIHEMAYIDDELWFINTRFSCLCTLDPVHSFIPRWRPPFVTAYDLSDRTHLNGLGVREGKPRYITALGATDSKEGWRKNKANGGILLDISNNEFIAQGLSMPHSPRWYRDQLWVLESGKGTLAKVDLNTGQLTTVTELPGFTRGIDFYGDFAFIGLSQVRETAVFSGIPITERLQERTCGVWVVNINTGETAAFLKFEDAVQEIFAVSVLPGILFPEVIDWDEKLLGSTFVLPDEILKETLINEQVSVNSKQLNVKIEIDSFSIIIPIYNIETKGKDIIFRTLNSIEESINYFIKYYPNSELFTHEIILVDDASTDQTIPILQDYITNKHNYNYQIIQHQTNQKQATARNTGVKNSTGKAIFFCDYDDLYLPEHIYICLELMNQQFPDQNKPLLPIINDYPAAVKTGVRLKDAVHSYWHQMIKNSLVLNLCIRRDVHEFMEGFCEDAVFFLSEYAQEDYVYNYLLVNFFTVAWQSLETVEYMRYPHNTFDKQLAKFQLPPESYQEQLSKKEQGYQQQIQQIITDKQAYLQSKIENSIFKKEPTLSPFDRAKIIEQNLQKQEINDPQFKEQKTTKIDELLNLGNEAYFARNLEQAKTYYQQCLKLNKNLVIARYNLGVVYVEQEQWEKAKIELETVIKLQPNYAQAYNNLGMYYQHQHQLDQAIKHYQKAIEIQSNFPDAHLNLSMVLLQKGDFKQGLQEWEWRWQTSQFTPFQCPHPQWYGEDISHQTLLVYTEQGVGDAIQFIRYLPLIKKQCHKIIFICIQELVSLFSTVLEIDQILTPGNLNLAEFQTYTPLMSIPHIVGTNLTNIPAEIPYLKVPLISQQKQWKNLLNLDEIPSNNLKIGIVWSGSKTHKDNHNRSCNLDHFSSLFKLKKCVFYSLQKEVDLREQEILKKHNIQDLSLDLEDFGDTAAVISHLDLIITVDTSVAHLAGALGQQVWTILCYTPDWRWLLERNDTPWYPTMKLFRQSQPKNWDQVFRQVKQELLKQFKN